MDEYEQAKLIFGKIKGMVEAAGGAMADVVKVTIYVTDIKNNTKVWAARARVLHRRLPGLDPGRGERARSTGDPGRDRGDRPHRQGQALKKTT